LRIATSDTIQYCRFALKDLEAAINEQYKAKSKDFRGLLYRGTYLSEKEWNQLQGNIGQEIEMFGFLSTSKKEIAEKFLKKDRAKKALITIIVPQGPNEGEEGFAEIKEFAIEKFKKEDEVLFNVRSRFTILQAESEEINGVMCRHLVLFYGAQAWRKYLKQHDCVQNIPIEQEEKHLALLKCVYCQLQIQGISSYDYRSLRKKDEYICNHCAEFKNNLLEPLLCIPFGESQNRNRNLGGRIMTYPNSQDLKIPFYGYKCVECQLTKGEVYYKCVECQDSRKRLWCKECVFGKSECLLEKRHNMILEKIPFSFWHEKMTESEFHHVIYEEGVIDNHTLQQAEIFYRSYEYEKAIQYYHQFIRNNPQRYTVLNANCYSNLGFLYSILRKYDDAIENYLECLEIARVLKKDEEGMVANCNCQLGKVYERAGKLQMALSYYTKALEDLLVVHRGRYHQDIAGCFGNIATIYDLTGEYAKAIEYFEQSLEIYDLLYDQNHPLFAKCHNNIGLVYQNMGRYDEAFSHISRALEIQVGIYGDKHHESATMYGTLSTIYLMRGEYQKAIEYQSKRLEINKLIFGENHKLVAECYNNLGATFCKMGEFEKALEFYYQTLDIFQQIGEKDLGKLATYNSNIGVALIKIEQFSKAIEFLEKAQEMYEVVYGKGHNLLATCFNNFGLAYNKLGQYQKALEYQSKSVQMYLAVVGEQIQRIRIITWVLSIITLENMKRQ